MCGGFGTYVVVGCVVWVSGGVGVGRVGVVCGVSDGLIVCGRCGVCVFCVFGGVSGSFGCRVIWGLCGVSCSRGMCGVGCVYGGGGVRVVCGVGGVSGDGVCAVYVVGGKCGGVSIVVETASFCFAIVSPLFRRCFVTGFVR